MESKVNIITLEKMHHKFLVHSAIFPWSLMKTDEEERTLAHSIEHSLIYVTRNTIDPSKKHKKFVDNFYLLCHHWLLCSYRYNVISSISYFSKHRNIVINLENQSILGDESARSFKHPLINVIKPRPNTNRCILGKPHGRWTSRHPPEGYE